MRNETTIETEVVVDDAPITTAALRPQPRSDVQHDPSWDRARELLAAFKSSYVELADEILRRREAHSLGHGGSRRGSSFQNGNLKLYQGFVAQLRDQLGISYKVAQTYLQQADYQRRLVALSNGEPVQLEDGRRLMPDAQKQALAREALDTLSLPGVRPSRLWAGVMGGAVTKGVDRAEVDHSRNIRRALVTLSNSLQAYDELPADDRAMHDKAWQNLLDAGVIPGAWAAAAAAAFEARRR